MGVSEKDEPLSIKVSENIIVSENIPRLKIVDRDIRLAMYLLFINILWAFLSCYIPAWLCISEIWFSTIGTILISAIGIYLLKQARRMAEEIRSLIQ